MAWAEYRIDKEQMIGLAIGPLRIWISRVADEWLIGWIYEESEGPSTAPSNVIPETFELDPPEDLNWQRWSCATEESALRLMPALPDRPVCAKPLIPLKLPAGLSATVYLRIPVWFKLIVGDLKSPVTLCEIPLVELSNAWFGDPVSGELCYSLSTRAEREVVDTPYAHYEAICRLNIKNKTSSEELEFDKICLRAPYLTLYNYDDLLWTNQVNITFKGKVNVSDVRYDKQPPHKIRSCLELSKPRNPPKSMFKRTFSDFHSWVYG